MLELDRKKLKVVVAQSCLTLCDLHSANTHPMHPPRVGRIYFHTLDYDFGHETCFSQGDISRQEILVHIRKTKT